MEPCDMADWGMADSFWYNNSICIQKRADLTKLKGDGQSLGDFGVNLLIKPNLCAENNENCDEFQLSLLRKTREKPSEYSFNIRLFTSELYFDFKDYE
jgi:hypothetical protein